MTAGAAPDVEHGRDDAVEDAALLGRGRPVPPVEPQGDEEVGILAHQSEKGWRHHTDYLAWP